MPLTPQCSITCEVKSAPFCSNSSARLPHAFIMQLDSLVTVCRPSCNSRTVTNFFLKFSYGEVYWLHNIIVQVFNKGLMKGVCYYNTMQFHFPAQIFLMLHICNSPPMFHPVENHFPPDRLCSSVSSSLACSGAILDRFLSGCPLSLSSLHTSWCFWSNYFFLSLKVFNLCRYTIEYLTIN